MMLVLFGRVTETDNMRASELILEGRNYPVIVVDVQPAYDSSICRKIVEFVNGQTGPVLMFVNADRDGLTNDTVQSVVEYWNNTVCPEDERYTYDEESDDYVENPNCPTINWQRFQIVDKGFGYFRGWMDQGVPARFIIQLIRYMYQNKLNDIRDDIDGVYQFMNNTPINGEVVYWEDWMEDESFVINWTSVAQLKRFSGAYLVGGGREECLREVELLMNAFNIKYKRIDSLVY